MRYLSRTNARGRRWAVAALGVALLASLFVVYRYTASDRAVQGSWAHPGRVATLNVTNPRGTPPGPIADYIARVKPEVIAFQEACVNRTNRIAAELRKRGMNYTVVHGSMTRQFGRCGLGDGYLVGASGNALLLANGITGDHGNIPYDTGTPAEDNGERRGYVYAQTIVNGSQVTVYGTQLSQHKQSLAGVRTEQAKELAEAAGAFDPNKNSIIMGDFNTVPNETVLQRIRTAWVDADPNCGAKPNGNCVGTQVGSGKKLDYIWLKPRFYPRRSGVHTVRTWKRPEDDYQPGKEQGPREHSQYTDHDLVYTDLPPAAHPPSAKVDEQGWYIQARRCERGETDPCVDPYLLTAAGTGQVGRGNATYVAPRRMYVGSNFVLDKLEWTRWGQRSALGLGRMAGTTCDPTCAEGTVRDYGPVEVEIFRLATTSDHRRLYTCGRVRKPGQEWGSVDPSLKKVCVSPND